MLDPTLCSDANSAWAAFTWRLTNQLTPLLPVAIKLAWILLVIQAMIWLVGRSRPTKLRRLQQLQRQGWMKLITGLTIVMVLVTSPLSVLFGSKVLVHLLPADLGQPADAIVVLGRGNQMLEDRVQAAAALWQAHRAPKIFASGRGDAQPIIDQLQRRGVSPEALNGEGCSATTEENARFTAAMLLPQGVKRIVLVTDAPHMLRSFLTFRSLGFDVIPHVSSLPTTISYRQKSVLVFREYGGLASYFLKGRFRDRQYSALQRTPPASTSHHDVAIPAQS